MDQLVWMILIGVVTGIVVGLTGGSGFVIIIPLLTIVFNFSIYEAIGTSLTVDIIASIIASYTYYKHDNIDFKQGIWIALGAVIGAQIGVIIAVSLPESGLGEYFVIMLILMGYSTWRRGIRNVNTERSPSRLSKINRNEYKIIIAVFLGFLIGIQTGMIGAGGGGTIFVILVFVFDFPIQKAVGTSTLIMAVTALSGSIGYVSGGNIDYIATLVIGIAASMSSIFTAHYVNKIDEETAGKAIALTFLIIGVFMLYLQIIELENRFLKQKF